MVPDRISDLVLPTAKFSQDPRVANIQWQLDWPGNSDSFQSFLGQRNITAPFTALVTNEPSDITDRYERENTGNCASILRDQCTQSLAQAPSTGLVAFSSLEGCEDTPNANEGG